MKKLSKFYEYLSSKGHCDCDGIVDIKGGTPDQPKEKITASEDPVNAKEKCKCKNVEKKNGQQAQVKESRFPSYVEYLNSKGKLTEPKTEIVADFHDESPAAPPESTVKGKNWDAKAPKASKPAPYKSGSNAIPKKLDSGLGDRGSMPKEEIVIKKGSSKYFPGGQEVADFATKTEQFIAQTKNLPAKKFVEKMLKENTVEVPLNLQFPPQTVNYLVKLAEQDGVVLRNLVVQLKNHNLFPELFETMFDYSEAWSTLAQLLENEQCCNSLARALYQESIGEAVGPSIGFSNEQPKAQPTGEEGEEPEEGESEDDENVDQDLEDLESELADEVENGSEEGGESPENPEGEPNVGGGNPNAAMNVPENAINKLANAMAKYFKN
jgi:hypothetical protein